MPRAAPVLLAASAVVALAVALSPAGDATFAASTGFSGRNGADCSVCHQPPALQEATVRVEGVPSTWEVGASYPLTVVVEGGPPAVPALHPQGGFEIDTDTGSFRVPDAMQGLVRTEQGHIATYTPEGTLMRQWTVIWDAPTGPVAPYPAGFWIGAIAANGDHNPLLNISDGGERLDAAATDFVGSPASDTVAEAWQAIPLPPPHVEWRRAAGVQARWHIDVFATDRNVTVLAGITDGDIRSDASAEALEETRDGPPPKVGESFGAADPMMAAEWIIDAGPLGGRLFVWQEATGRISPSVVLEIDEHQIRRLDGTPARDTPWLPIVGLIPLLGAVAAAKRP